MKHHHTLLIAIGCAQALAAQDLATEIKVDRTVAPEFHMANKPYVAPQFAPLPDIAANPMPAEYLLPGTISRSIPTLAVAPWQDSIAPTPYRGYASVGLWPKNYGADLGYRFARTAKASAGAWAQVASERYDSERLARKGSIGADNATIGIDGAVRTGLASWLSAKAAYDFWHVALPADDSYNFSRAFAEGKWEGRTRRLAYRLGAGYGYYSSNPRGASESQSLGKADGGIAVFADSKVSVLGIDVSAQWLSSSAHGAPTKGLYSMIPYVRLRLDAFKAKLGVNVSTNTGGDNNHGLVAPEVRLAYAPARSAVAAYLNFTGMQRLNPVFDYLLLDPYALANRPFDSSRMPLKIEGALNLGSFGGFSAWINAQYGIFRDWLMPSSTGFMPWNFNSWKAGAGAKYAFTTYAEASVAYEVADSDTGLFTWGDWHDSAKQQLKASLAVTPLTGFRFAAAYTLRSDRKAIASPSSSEDPYAEENLMTLSRLDINASYTMSDVLSVPVTFFVNIDNALNSRHLGLSGWECAPFRAMLGASVQF